MLTRRGGESSRSLPAAPEVRPGRYLFATTAHQLRGCVFWRRRATSACTTVRFPGSSSARVCHQAFPHRRHNSFLRICLSHLMVATTHPEASELAVEPASTSKSRDHPGLYSRQSPPRIYYEGAHGQGGGERLLTLYITQP